MIFIEYSAKQVGFSIESVFMVITLILGKTPIFHYLVKVIKVVKVSNEPLDLN